MSKRFTAGAVLVLSALAAACEEGDILVKPEPVPVAGCLEPPNELARPPARGLPCELMPPGWQP
jgi:hypothetical protein